MANPEHEAEPTESAGTAVSADNESETQTPVAAEPDSAPPSDGAQTVVTGEVHPRMKIKDSDTDEEITAKLIKQGVRLGKGTIAPRVFWP